jgi:hypothetical protein
VERDADAAATALIQHYQRTGEYLAAPLSAL